MVMMKKPYSLKVVASLPITGKIVPFGDVCLEPIRMLVENLNNRSDILPEYNFIVDIIDDKCSESVALERSLNSFFLNQQRIFKVQNGTEKSIGQYRFPESFEFVHETASTFYVPPIMTGPVCSGVCMVLGNLVKSFNTVHVHISPSMYFFLFKNITFYFQYAGVGCNSMVMDDEDRFPNTYRTWSVAQFADSAISFIRQLDWKKVSIISDSIAFNLQVCIIS